MPLPKVVATAACVAMLGAQLAVATPLASERSWYWPFLPYPMYAKAHVASDTLVVPQLRVRECGHAAPEEVLDASALGTPLHRLRSVLTIIVGAPGSASADSAKDRIGRAIEAEFPGRYCSASAWARVVRVADTATYGLHSQMRRAVAWNMSDTTSI
jgi:hypothetical protein